MFPNPYSIVSNEIWKIDNTGNSKLFAGLNDYQLHLDGKGVEARFTQAKAIAADAAGNVCVAENPATYEISSSIDPLTIFYQPGLTLRKIDRDGTVTTINNKDALVGNITGLAIDHSGAFYVSGNTSSSGKEAGIFKMSAAGEVITLAGASSFGANPEGADGQGEKNVFLARLRF